MRETYLVRHGQASARARDYDVLSPLGEQQARALGRRIAVEKLPIEALFSGPRKRQRDTALHLIAAAREHGLELPEPRELPSGDEIPLDAILAVWLPRVVDSDAVARSIAQRDFEHDLREVRRVLIGAMQAWAAGEVTAPSLPTFEQFCARVDEALHEVRGTAATTLFVTSAGPVATALHLAAHEGLTTPADVMRLAMAIENASVTRLVHDGTRLAVGAAFDVAHLLADERTLI